MSSLPDTFSPEHVTANYDKLDSGRASIDSDFPYALQRRVWEDSKKCIYLGPYMKEPIEATMSKDDARLYRLSRQNPYYVDMIWTANHLRKNKPHREWLVLDNPSLAGPRPADAPPIRRGPNYTPMDGERGEHGSCARKVGLSSVLEAFAYAVTAQDIDFHRCAAQTTLALQDDCEYSFDELFPPNKWPLFDVDDCCAEHRKKAARRLRIAKASLAGFIITDKTETLTDPLPTSSRSFKPGPASSKSRKPDPKPAASKSLVLDNGKITHFMGVRESGFVSHWPAPRLRKTTQPLPGQGTYLFGVSPSEVLRRVGGASARSAGTLPGGSVSSGDMPVSSDEPTSSTLGSAAPITSDWGSSDNGWGSSDNGWGASDNSWGSTWGSSHSGWGSTRVSSLGSSSSQSAASGSRSSQATTDMRELLGRDSEEVTTADWGSSSRTAGGWGSASLPTALRSPFRSPCSSPALHSSQDLPSESDQGRSDISQDDARSSHDGAELSEGEYGLSLSCK